MSQSKDNATAAMVESWLLVVRQSPHQFAAVLKRAQRQLAQWAPALMVLARARKPASVVAVKMLREVVNQADGIATLFEIYEHLPRKSSLVAKVAAQTTERLLNSLRRAGVLDVNTEAMFWNNRSEYCQDANLPDAALRCAKKAVGLCRGFSGKDPVQLRIRIICLLTFAKRRAERNQVRAALRIATLAWRLSKRLARSGQPEDLRLMAQALANRANRLGAVGRINAAIKAAKQAQTIHSDLPDSPDSSYDVAISELSLANQLINLGRFEDALPRADNADRLFRVLAGWNPDEYLEYSVAAANAYSIVLSHIGQLSVAYDLSCQAKERMAVLARRHPARFSREFSVQLINTADCAGDLGKFDEALDHARQAVTEARRAGRHLKRRDWYLEGVAGTNLFNLLYRLQKFDEAKSAITTAARALMKLPANHPQVRPELARALRGLAEIYRMRDRPGDPQRAVRLAGKALGVLCSKPRVRSEAVSQIEFHCRTTLALCLENAGRLRDAIEAEKPSLALRRKFFDRSTKVYRTDLAFGLFVQARRLSEIGEQDEALALAKEAVEHYRIALPTSPERTAAFLADALHALAAIHVKMGQRSQGIRALESGIELLRPRYEKSPSVWQVSLLPFCARFLEWCSDATKHPLTPFVRQVIVEAKTRQSVH